LIILFILLVGTAGNIVWKLRCIGKLFHSGLPHKGINSIEFGMDTITYLQQQFYNDYPRHEKENEYSYLTSSNFKPTQISCSSGALNQLPAECIIQGDLRLTPFYDINDVKIKIESYINNINQNPSILQQPENCNIIHGPQSKYILDNSNSNSSVESDVEKARIELTWLSSGENGVACKLDSIGYKAIIEATKKVLGT
jgi:acetylornithine deacetylase